MHTLLDLFLSFLQIGLFSFGGGYAAMPLIEQQVVTGHGWLTMAEFTDLITISQMTPGPIAVNSATFVGIRIAGIPGALVATIGCILPSCILVTLIARLYLKYRKLDLLQGVLASLRPAGGGAHRRSRGLDPHHRLLGGRPGSPWEHQLGDGRYLRRRLPSVKKGKSRPDPGDGPCRRRQGPRRRPLRPVKNARREAGLLF